MPQFDITSPEGKKFRITAPEGATKEQALSFNAYVQVGAKGGAEECRRWSIVALDAGPGLSAACVARVNDARARANKDENFIE